MSSKTQTRLSDSKSWILALKHFTRQNCGLEEPVKSQKDSSNQLHHVIMSTFDCWLGIRQINVQQSAWKTLVNMKMAMPAVNASIEFNEQFKPLSFALAYYDGSIECCPWDQMHNYYANEIIAGKKRQLKKTYPEIIKQVKRPAYLNIINEDQKKIEEAFMLETICFLNKKGQYIYAMNFKGQLKILKLANDGKTLNLIEKFTFENRICQVELISSFGEHNNGSDSLLIAVCF